MAYEQEGLEEENPDAYMPALQGEQAGVAHLVHGWIQQGNEKKVLYSSYTTNAILNTIIGALCIPRYYTHKHLSGCCRVILPYDKVHCKNHRRHVQSGFS